MSTEAALLHAEDRARQAASIASLAFTIANETWQVLPYRQGLVWRDKEGHPELLTVSGLAALAEDSPFTVWAKRLAKAAWPALGEQPFALDLADIEDGRAQETVLTPEIVHGWQEWWPPHLILVPIVKDGVRLGAAMFLFDHPPGEQALAALTRLQSSWSYCAWALLHTNRKRFEWKMPARRMRWVVAACCAGVLLLPVRQTALAPVEIVALKAVAVAAPLDGVVKTFHVQPNQRVQQGDPLFSLDDTTLRNRREVAARALEVAAAELLSAQQRAFDDPKARAEVGMLQGRIVERRTELQAVEEQLGRIHVAAPRDGIAVFGDVNDWQGRPVATGERVMQLADPADAGVLVYLPVADAIALNEGARIRAFLHVAPLSPIEASLSETSYQSVLSPDGVASYRLRGTVEESDRETARIGLKGTAKLYGDRVLLFYYVLRRPIAVLRQWSGL